MLEVDITVKEEDKCCFCERYIPVDIQQHMNLCGTMRGFNDYDHIDVFCKLVFTELIPVKQDLTGYCINCKN
ncbi:unnamed protein product [Caenorhabditis sp. 36 PRJEB53466]|nr:unnamed protein product [Caenorhabditis sp. 36 PRJEB53466]